MKAPQCACVPVWCSLIRKQIGQRTSLWRWSLVTGSYWQKRQVPDHTVSLTVELRVIRLKQDERAGQQLTALLVYYYLKICV